MHNGDSKIKIMTGKRDLVIITGFLVFAVVLFLVSAFVNRIPGDRVIVEVDGKEAVCFPLSENTEYVIKGVHFTNTLVIRDGEAYISEAECPDKICVRHGNISKSGESIVCLPNRVVVKIAGEAAEADAVAE